MSRVDDRYRRPKQHRYFPPTFAENAEHIIFSGSGISIRLGEVRTNYTIEKYPATDRD
jgi:hypothetical protein